MSDRFKPHAYQRAGVRWLVEHPAAALLWDPGLGKTAVTLAAFLALQKAGGVRKALVVAPKRVCYEVWSASGELGRWSDFAGLRVALLHGDDKNEALEQDADLYVINPDGLRWLTTDGRLRKLLTRGVDTLVVDELSKFKNTRSQRFGYLRPWLSHFKRRWGLTGSPASNGLIDLFGQVYVLDLGKALGQYVTHYRNRYFTSSGFNGHDWKLEKGAEEKIHAAVKSTCQALRAEDHLDLPPLIERDVFVVLPPAARRAYDDMEEDLVAQLEAGIITAANAAVASAKCRQLASGGVYREAEAPELGVAAKRREAVVVHDAKTEALADLVEELQGQSLLVAYEWEHDLERIRAALGEVPAINGKTTPRAAAAMIKLWNEGRVPVLAGHPAAMAHGLNLQAGGGHVAWYSLTWDQELYDQTVRRLYRQGTTAARVVVHRILARDTLDEVVAQMLAQKTRTQDALLDALKARVRRRRVA